MAHTAHSDNRRRSGAAPRIEVRPAEEQLASDTRLLGRDRPLSRKTAQAIAADPKILGGAPSIEPLVRTRRSSGDKPRRDTIRYEVGQLHQQLIEDTITVAERCRSYRRLTFNKIKCGDCNVSAMDSLALS